MKNQLHQSVSEGESTLNLINVLLVKYVFAYVRWIYPLWIGDLKRILKENNCLIIVLISEFVYFVAIVLSTVQQAVYE